MRSKKMIITSIILSSVLAIGLAVPASLALYSKEAKNNGSYGEVYLRSYYHCGSGTDDDPYIITRPRHLYNLSRLHGLGVYTTRTVFKLGYDLDGSGVPKCYLSDTDDTIVPFMDMGDCDYENETIYSIGSEATPFYGEFDGRNLEIKNLKVYADSQDAGLFGYTAHGSNVHNLFLDNITINTLGYDSMFEDLYAVSSDADSAAYAVHFDYTRGDTTKDFTPGDEDTADSFKFPRNKTTGAIVGSPDIPEVVFRTTNDFSYELLISGDLLTRVAREGQTDKVEVDLGKAFTAFQNQITEDETKGKATSFPLVKTSTVSLVASSIDPEGLEHSRVVMTLNFTFTLDGKSETFIKMETKLEEDHGNNIGLLIGHCDGSASDCYVHDGKFIMNNGTAITGEERESLVNYSAEGLIGRTGKTVHNKAAQESDASTRLGKNIGVLDFTTIYDSIIRSGETFPYVDDGNHSLGYSFTPKETDYISSLRLNTSGKYVTGAQNSVSFNGQRVIRNKELGVFTVATDFNNDGMGVNASTHLAETESMVKHFSDLGNNSSNIYYAMGEFNASNGIAYSKYLSSIVDDRPDTLYPGYHLPSIGEVTSESFAVREMFQNYVFRFKLDPANRTNNSRFYLSKLGDDTVGGNFLTKYFHYKLRKDGDELAEDSSLAGIMIRNPDGDEIGSLSSGFASPDMYSNSTRMWNIYDSDSKAYYSSNMVNFEIKTEGGKEANVTVVAAQKDPTKPAALGVYRISGKTMTKSGDYYYFNRTAVDSTFPPDYAFFMPARSRLVYFDYDADADGEGRIGNYDSEGNFTEAEYGTEAKTAAESDYEYTAGKMRLYAHTFKLPAGRYCFASATPDSGSYTTARVFYVCAQGQDRGTLDYDDNVYTTRDAVENIDFVKVPRYELIDHDDDPLTEKVLKTNIILGDPIYEEDPDVQNKRLFRQRCYIALKSSKRSSFASELCSIAFNYDTSDDTFYITAPSIGYPDSGTANAFLSQMTKVLVTNYGDGHVVKDAQDHVYSIDNTLLSLFGGESSRVMEQKYPANAE